MQEIRVLLVDDEEEFTSALAERLNMRGISTTTTSVGEEALQMIETDPPQVVLLDLMMPGLGGKEIFDRIRLKHPDISVIFLTGLGTEEIGPAACEDCFVKPVNINDLIQKIRSVSIKG